MDEDDVRRAIGLADSCELMAAAFAFPDAELAAALADGSFQSDALACLADAGAATATVDKAAAALSMARTLSGWPIGCARATPFCT